MDADKFVPQQTRKRYITVSIGITCLSPTQELSPEDLIAIADLALYEAKANGRNGYKVGSRSQNFEA